MYFLAGREELEPGTLFRGAGLWDNIEQLPGQWFPFRRSTFSGSRTRSSPWSACTSALHYKWANGHQWLHQPIYL